MDQEIRVGDWISYPVAGLESRGKVVSIDEYGYGVRVRGSRSSVTMVPFGEGVRKIDPPEDEEQT